MKKYCAYLRKSRKDMEAELKGEGETLKRHENILRRYAESANIEISRLYREIVSGETISARPVMQELLTDVEQGIWDGVLVVEVERLARGNSIDQGMVSQVFKFSDTKIITPSKTYDPNNEFDEEYFEFGLFMSRREYKTINRRLNSGRISSVMEGKFVGHKTAYGYDRVKLENEKGFKLVINPSQADVVKMIYHLYVDEDYSCIQICDRLNQLGIKPKINDEWRSDAMYSILDNPVYIGKIRWNYRKQVKTTMNGEIKLSRPKNEDVLIVDGLHEAIIDIDTWERVREKRRLGAPKTVVDKQLQNPLAGIIICEKCGKKMTRRPYPSQEPGLICNNRKCDNISSKLPLVEKKLIEALSLWLEGFKIEYDGEQKEFDYITMSERSLMNLQKSLEDEEAKFDKLCNFLEEGIYDKDTFRSRSIVIKENINKFLNQIKELETYIANQKEIQEQSDSYIPKIENIINLYYSNISVKEKNDLIKSIVEKVTYYKDKNARWHNDPNDFTLKIFPKVYKHAK